MTYNFSLCFYTQFKSFRAQCIIGKCSNRHLFPYGGLALLALLDLFCRRRALIFQSISVFLKLITLVLKISVICKKNTFRIRTLKLIPFKAKFSSYITLAESPSFFAVCFCSWTPRPTTSVSGTLVVDFTTISERKMAPLSLSCLHCTSSLSCKTNF